MSVQLTTLLSIILLVAILAFYNRRQAKALHGVERMVKDFLAIQIRARRDQYKATIESLDSTQWLERLINARTEKEVTLKEILRILPEISAAEIATDDNRKIVVSMKPKDTLKQYDKIVRARGGAAQRIATIASKPILGRKYKALEVNMVDESEYFDMEAEFVGNALGVSWKQPTRLWIYIIG